MTLQNIPGVNQNVLQKNFTFVRFQDLQPSQQYLANSHTGKYKFSGAPLERTR